MLAQRAKDNLSAVAFCNLVGGQDELVFDGHSVVVDHEGRVIARAPQFAESLTFATVDVQRALTARLRDTRLRPAVHRMLPEVRHAGTLEREVREAAPGGDVAEWLEPEEAEVYAALTLGTRDYVEKNGFGRVVIGLSGGIDSTLVALIAVDALGADRVTCVSMPSRYSSSGTKDDARALAESLGVEFLEIPIATAMEVYDELLAERFEGRDPDITEENLQARIRGNLLMALSNKFGWLVLTTGNKSETSVGYSTLYGDTAGGFAVIKDVPKTLVYRLVDVRNARDEQHPVPQSIIDRPPSAELRPDQKDQDSLPDYDTLDRILEAYIEEDADREQLVGGRPARGGGRPGARARGPRGVQAAPGAAGDQDHAAGVRAGSADADHQPLPRLGLGLRPRCGRRRGRLAVTRGVGNGVGTCGRGSVRRLARVGESRSWLSRGTQLATRPGVAGCAGPSSSLPCRR